jgi:hypothetical protein
MTMRAIRRKRDDRPDEFTQTEETQTDEATE